MPQLLHPQKIVTKDGEIAVYLTIDLNVNVNSSGGVSVSATPVEKQKQKQKDDPEWEVPDFGPAPKVKFGK